MASSILKYDKLSQKLIMKKSMKLHLILIIFAHNNDMLCNIPHLFNMDYTRISRNNPI